MGDSGKGAGAAYSGRHKVGHTRCKIFTGCKIWHPQVLGTHAMPPDSRHTVFCSQV